MVIVVLVGLFLGFVGGIEKMGMAVGSCAVLPLVHGCGCVGFESWYEGF